MVVENEFERQRRATATSMRSPRGTQVNETITPIAIFNPFTLLRCRFWSFGVLTCAGQDSRPDGQLDGPEGSVESLLLSKSHHLHGPAVDAPLIVAMDEHLPNCGLEVSAFNRGQKRNVKLTRLGKLLHYRLS